MLQVAVGYIHLVMMTTGAGVLTGVCAVQQVKVAAVSLTSKFAVSNAFLNFGWHSIPVECTPGMNFIQHVIFITSTVGGES